MLLMFRDYTGTNEALIYYTMDFFGVSFLLYNMHIKCSQDSGKQFWRTVSTVKSINRISFACHKFLPNLLVQDQPRIP